MNIYLKRLIKLSLIPIAVILGLLWELFYFIFGMIITFFCAPVVYLVAGKDLVWWWMEGLDWYFNITYKIEGKIDLL